MNRREFLRALAGAGCAAVAPGCFSAKAYRANSKVRLAAIGCGAQAWYDLKMLAGNEDLCEVVALCDTDIGAPHTLEALRQYPQLPRFTDFRTMFDRVGGSIDAVLVGTPDHSHFCATMHALSLGKHVYVEKPLAHSFRECELLRTAEARTGLVCQMGNQGHSGDNFWQYREYFRQGRLKNVVKVVSHMNMQRRWHKWGGKVAGYPAAESLPATLDWEAWIASAPYHDFSKDLAYGEWRCWFDYGNGCMGDWGAHILDTVHRFTLGCALPEKVEIANLRGANPYVFPVQDTLTMTFPARDGRAAVKVEWWEGLDNQPHPPAGYRFDSNRGLFPANDANDGLIDPKLKPGKEIYEADGTIWQGLSHSSTLKLVGGGELPDYPHAQCDHWRNFLLACRGEMAVQSPFSVAAPLSQLFCLGVIAQRTGRGFAFDAAAKRIVGDDEADRLLAGPAPRPGWSEYYRRDFIA